MTARRVLDPKAKLTRPPIVFESPGSFEELWRIHISISAQLAAPPSPSGRDPQHAPRDCRFFCFPGAAAETTGSRTDTQTPLGARPPGRLARHPLLQ